MTELRAARDLEYRALLDAQKEQRGELIDRQDRGLSSPFLLDRAYPSEQREPEQASEAARIADALDRFGIRRGRAAEAEEEREVEVRPRSTDERYGLRAARRAERRRAAVGNRTCRQSIRRNNSTRSGPC